MMEFDQVEEGVTEKCFASKARQGRARQGKATDRIIILALQCMYMDIYVCLCVRAHLSIGREAPPPPPKEEEEEMDMGDLFG